MVVVGRAALVLAVESATAGIGVSAAAAAGHPRGLPYCHACLAQPERPACNSQNPCYWLLLPPKAQGREVIKTQCRTRVCPYGRLPAVCCVDGGW